MHVSKAIFFYLLAISITLITLSCDFSETSKKGEKGMIQDLILATESLEKNDYKEAKRISTKILSSDPYNPLAIEIAAISMRMLGEQPESYEMRQRQASLPPRKLSKKEEEIKSRLAKQTVRFIRDTTIRCKPEALNYADMGGRLAMQGNFDKAEEYFAKAIQISPDCEPVYFNRAVMAYNRKDFKSAAYNAKEVLRINPANEQAQRMLKMLKDSN
jgi:Tfp pilus assembly protein PilF